MFHELNMSACDDGHGVIESGEIMIDCNHQKLSYMRRAADAGVPTINHHISLV